MPHALEGPISVQRPLNKPRFPTFSGVRGVNSPTHSEGWPVQQRSILDGFGPPHVRLRKGLSRTPESLFRVTGRPLASKCAGSGESPWLLGLLAIMYILGDGERTPRAGKLPVASGWPQREGLEHSSQMS